MRTFPSSQSPDLVPDRGIFVSRPRILAASSERHSLIYIYTMLSADLDVPGIHKFTASGLLDGKQFDRFDSETPKKIPTTTWARRHLNAAYWEKGTKSRLGKQQWFELNLPIAMEAMGHGESDGNVHVLQWTHGCYGEKNPSEDDLRYVRGVDKYAYDGEDFMYFDHVTLQWIAAVEAAKPAATKWNDVTVLMEYTKGYLGNECVDWLTMYVRARVDTVNIPDVYLFTRETSGPTLTLTCMASGFNFNTAVMKLMKNGRVLDADDGLQVSDTLPNNDYTYQKRIAVDILPSDTGNFTCEVSEEQTTYLLVKHWRQTGDRSAPGLGNSGLLYALISAMVCLCTVALCVTVCIVRKRRSRQVVNQTEIVAYNSTGYKGHSECDT
ncbi:unnamed protein product [Oreochromis niloticus]|nr:unnamed protein product [Mustela putorius furo]